MSYLLGIDLGTTRTSAAIARGGARPGEIEVVSLGDRASAVPSVLFLAPDGSFLVGEHAERRAVTDPDRVVREFKRRIGDPTPVVVAGQPWSAQDLSARVVRWVVDRVAEREGGSAARIAVTHPASWGAHKKELLAGALAGQGLSVTFLAEPQAAALHYAAHERVEPGSTIAVYDLGGGTFDAAVVRKDAGFQLLGRPEGLERLGGVDFDEVVFEHVREGLPDAFDGLDDTDPAVLSAVARVRRECTEAKEALSSDTEVSIPVLMPGSRGSVRLHRSEFEAMIRPQVEETVTALRRAVASAGLTPEQLSAVLLVGGSSRIPLVAQLVSEQLGRPVAVDADPKNAIAKGAALALSPTGGTGAMPAATPGPRNGPGGRPGMAGAAAGAAAGLAAGGLGGPGVPPPPPRPTTSGGQPVVDPATSALPQPPAGPTGTGAYASGTGAYASAPPPRPSGGGGYSGPQQHRPDATRVGATPPVPPHPRRDPQPERYADDEEPGRGRRSPALLVTAGGLVAAVAVVAAILLWPGGPEAGGTGGVVPDVPFETTAPVTTEVQAPATEDATPDQPQVTRAPAPPPVRTTQPPRPTTAAPTTPPPTTTTEEPPPPTSEPPTEEAAADAADGG
ncbi:MAG TPA: Hsp70 family protein [Pseudonocardia sp.]|nr:Hsp70 family protein [Pseudonocardia sp.]